MIKRVPKGVFFCSLGHLKSWTRNRWGGFWRCHVCIGLSSAGKTFPRETLEINGLKIVRTPKTGAMPLCLKHNEPMKLSSRCWLFCSSCRSAKRIGSKRTPEQIQRASAWMEDEDKIKEAGRKQSITKKKTSKPRTKEHAEKCNAWQKDPVKKAKAVQRIVEKRALQKFPFNNTKPEQQIDKLLSSFEFQVIRQFRLPGLAHAFDFALPDLKILIEVDGCYWHLCEDRSCPNFTESPKADRLLQKRRDIDNGKFAESHGWKVIRLIAHLKGFQDLASLTNLLKGAFYEMGSEAG